MAFRLGGISTASDTQQCGLVASAITDGELPFTGMCGELDRDPAWGGDMVAALFCSTNELEACEPASLSIRPFPNHAPTVNMKTALIALI